MQDDSMSITRNKYRTNAVSRAIAEADRSAKRSAVSRPPKLNFVDPEAWLREALTRIAEGHRVNSIEEFAPCHLAI
jgi:hypothetical protein